MKLLAIDTTTEACSAALLMDNTVVEHYEVAPQKHTELILPMIDQLFRDSGLRLADLDGLAFARGPGAFSGVRICSSVIQALAFAQNLRVAAVSTLAALAADAYRITGQRRVLAALDARMQEVYWAGYDFDEDGLPCCDSGERVGKPADVLDVFDSNSDGDACVGIGSGWDTYEMELRACLPRGMHTVLHEH